MTNNFLAINKDYLGIGLKSIDILLISQIEEFQRNKCKCYVTNKQFSEMFGESESTIKRALDKLEECDIIKRTTTFIEGNGRGNRQRVLSVNHMKEWKVQI
jgi:predicted transcriptional regulator